ncbi:MAG: hypothetical protein Q4C89_03450 [Deinococcus sp.]|uniref:hypothetical protein n=1 Tax=Deinococcus sp. TaxID=47478 RepID=UPI0026DCA243|nr:hypothetical protein [Deinococcus sp.]MDO4245062.1 hypothetical protein [Deinococcus sp.]
MRTRLLLALLASSATAGALSGPSETRVPRAAETDAIIRAVCSGKADLGRLNGCKQTVYEGRPSSEIRSPKTMLLLTSVLSGSFTTPGQKELLATFCTETESCSGETVLLRQVRGQWQPVSLVPGFLPSKCLTYPRAGGTQAAACLGENARNEPMGNTLKIASWTGGKLKVETVALFPLLEFRDFFGKGSQQCAGRWQYETLDWDDRDRNADRVPDLTVLASLDTYKPVDGMCGAGLAFDQQPANSVRRDLTFVWTGETLRPTGTTAATLEKYAKGR